MFLKTWLRFFLLCLGILGYTSALLACSVGEHHSTSYHYNKAHKVFVGKLLHQEQQGADSLLLTFRVEQPYRACRAGEIVYLSTSSYNQLFLKAKRHLIYAEQMPSAALYCPKIEPLNNSNTRRQIQFIKKIIQQPLGGELIEYSPYGQVWARGYYTNGRPCDTWRFYAYSGELKIEGSYDEAGRRSGEWRGKVHISDKNYKVLHEIMTGAYAKKWDDYLVLGIDTNEQAEFRYTLRYLVQRDTVVEHFYYNNPHQERVINYRAGLQEGREAWFDEQGLVTKKYYFKQGYLDGEYFERIDLAQSQEGFIKVRGIYKQDKKQEEIHYYYHAQGHYLYQLILIENGKALAEPRRKT